MHIGIENRQSSTLGLYFHVPFCPHLCPYCDFVKTDRFKRSEVLAYFRWLEQELEDLLLDERVAKHRCVTVYFGGGTPGLFWGRFYASLLDRIRRSFDIEECTIECNPWLVSKEKMASWREVGFDRLTLGVQSLSGHVLDFLGRPHRRLDVERALEWARCSGFENIQVDLIYGLPEHVSGYSPSGDVESLASWGVSGVSCYALTVERETRFGASGIVACDERAADQYVELLETCERAGFVQRETSNFSRYECKHNNIYWYGLPYVGIGSGAHGLFGPDSKGLFGERYRYGPGHDSPARQQSAVGRDMLFAGPQQLHGASPVAPWFERVSEGYRGAVDAFIELSYTLLRTPMGLPGAWLASQSASGVVGGSQLWTAPAIVRSLELGHLKKGPDGSLSVTAKGLLLGDHLHQQVLQAVGLFRAQ